MKSMWNVAFEIRGLGTEKLLNEARKRGMVFSRMQRRPDRSIRVECRAGAYAAFQALGTEKGYQISSAEPVGLYRLWKGLLRRWGLLAGAALCLGLMIWAMGFIWEIRIENAGAYVGEVRLFLEESGIQVGMRRQQVDVNALQAQLEWRLPKVKWVRVEFRGPALRVHLEEGTPPPDIQSHMGSGDLVAAEDGVLLRLTVHAGTPVAQPGDLVKAGQVLIKGEERGANGEIIAVQARGQAIARIWVTARVQTSLQETLSFPTGKSAERRVVETPFFEYSLDDTPAFLTWDVDIQQQTIGGVWLPVSVRRERYLEVSLEKEARNLEEVKQEAAQGALRLLGQSLIGENIIDKWIDFRMIEGDTIVAAATAEIHRDIGRSEKN